MSDLDKAYEEVCRKPSDIQSHLPTIRELAVGCKRVVELGTRYGTSTTALLHAQPDELILVDVRDLGAFKKLEPLKGRTDLKFLLCDSRKAEIDDIDFMLVDTVHTYEHVRDELNQHAKHVKKAIAFHDTELAPKIKQAILELVDTGEFRIVSENKASNGMIVIERIL